jgi:glycosyltransferase involved in cell wall biosynthesis
MSGPSVVVAHDAFTAPGGAERVATAFLDRYPDAPLLAGAIRRAAFPGLTAGGREVRTTLLQSVAADPTRARALFAAWPLAFRRLRVPVADVLLTSSSAFAHHLRPRAGTTHVWYCHTPPRFLWDPDAYFLQRSTLRIVLRPWLDELRRLDLGAARAVHHVIANSAATADLVRRTYGRVADVLPPPVDLRRFAPTRARSGRFLVVSRLLPYKRVDLAVVAAARLGVGLDVIGDGPDRRRLERLAGPGTRFLGRLPDADVRAAMARATAILVPGREDFGLAIVEAQASGRPPIALAAGGAVETITDGRDGYLVPESTVEALVAAMDRARSETLDAERLRSSAARFDRSRFEARLDALLADIVGTRARVA